jgi:DNA-binding NarL/FixJ family response regulator
MNEPNLKKRIVVCEDHSIVLSGLKLLLNHSANYTLSASAHQGHELISLLKEKEKDADILILDLNLPDTDGITLLKTIREFNTHIKIVILTMYQDEFLVERARLEGANAFLLKNSGNDELLQALDTLDDNSFYVAEQLAQELTRKKLFKDDFAQKMKLTRRELEIIKLLAMGMTSLQAAGELSLSTHTVDTHRKNIFRKLEINSIADLVRFAHDNKII